MGACQESRVVFDTTALEKIVTDPQWILDNEQTFWADYRAQVLVRKWAGQVNYTIPYDKLRERMQEWANLSPAEREDHTLMKVCRRILEGKDEFLEKVLPHECTFLPPGVDLSVTVQFTAFIPPNAFAFEDIVIDVASKYWQGNPEHILNLLVHEIFHVGYSFYRTLHAEKDLVDADLYKLLDNIASEGICTYVGYRALPVFNVEDERDYRMLDDFDEVQRAFTSTNAVLSQFGILPAEELQKLSWDKGVVERAFYVTGAHICRTIEDHKGRQALIEVYSKGPLSIIALYNSIAEDGLKIVFPEGKNIT
jgi:hypothetical protein